MVCKRFVPILLPLILMVVLGGRGTGHIGPWHRGRYRDRGQVLKVQSVSSAEGGLDSQAHHSLGSTLIVISTINYCLLCVWHFPFITSFNPYPPFGEKMFSQQTLQEGSELR